MSDRALTAHVKGMYAVECVDGFLFTLRFPFLIASCRVRRWLPFHITLPLFVCEPPYHSSEKANLCEEPVRAILLATKAEPLKRDEKEAAISGVTKGH